MTKKKTVKRHDGLISAGPHESRGVPDARYLSIADRVLNHQENNEENVEVLAGSLAHSSEEAPSRKSNAKIRRDARFLLHYQQD